VETNVGIMFTCIHASRPILSKILPGFFGEVDRASSKNEKMKSISLSTEWSTYSRDTPSRSTSAAETKSERAGSPMDYAPPSAPRTARFGTSKSHIILGLCTADPRPANNGGTFGYV
jgi:hypothetical protein